MHKDHGWEALSLSLVSISDLSHTPRKVLDRVARGERLIVCCYGRPVATLQPLDGVVTQPFTGRAHDIYGWPVGGAAEEAAKLSDAQRELLTNGLSGGRLVTVGASVRFSFTEVDRSIKEMVLKGLVQKTERGLVLTGRGMVMRETLLQMKD
jgi:antitoxin (DNA-binding transcriptional repressor) of toxin-antitoxin stability system